MPSSSTTFPTTGRKEESIVGNLKRRRFQGVSNIVRFNWHFYVLTCVAMVMLALAGNFAPAPWNVAAWIIASVSLTAMTLSLAVSCYIYDCSDLYSLKWMPELSLPEGGNAVNIHAGFDETSYLLAKKFPDVTWRVFDFYDPALHTEISIARARKIYAPYPGTVNITTSNVPLAAASTSVMIGYFAFHEIRDRAERIRFFQALKTGLDDNGTIIMVEHLRDIANFIAYNIGFFHFLSKQEWTHTFANAGLHITRVDKITPFVSAYTLKKHGTSS